MERRPVKTSIIIPALNEQPGIALAVRRAWQAGTDEVIVVDGGSDDGTPQAAADAGGNVIVSEPGRGGQQNAGARASQGEVLLFLHADNWLETGAVGQIVEALHDARTQWGAFLQRIEAPATIYRLLERGNAFRARRLRLPYGDQGMFLRRELLECAGGFPNEPLMEDLLLARKLRRLARPVLLPGPLYVSARRWQRRGVVRQSARNWLLATAALAGVPPRRLVRFYPPHYSSPK